MIAELGSVSRITLLGHAPTTGHAVTSAQFTFPVASLGMSGRAFGENTACGPYKVTAIQAQSGDLLVNVADVSGNYWKEVGAWINASTKPYQALL